MGDLDLYQRKDALPHSYTPKRDEPPKHAIFLTCRCEILRRHSNRMLLR